MSDIIPTILFTNPEIESTKGDDGRITSMVFSFDSMDLNQNRTDLIASLDIDIEIQYLIYEPSYYEIHYIGDTRILTFNDLNDLTNTTIEFTTPVDPEDYDLPWSGIIIRNSENNDVLGLMVATDAENLNHGGFPSDFSRVDRVTTFFEDQTLMSTFRDYSGNDI